MRLLLFGAQGQLGQEMSALCEARDVDVVFANRAQCDISNATQVGDMLAAARPTAVINAAAYTKVDQAEKEPALARLANFNGPSNLARMCDSLTIPLVHVSTDYVFDGEKPSPYSEADPVAPLGVYGTSKEAGERAVREALDRHIIVRTAWVYGQYGQNFLKTMLNLAKTRDQWGVVQDQFGTPTATADLAEALLAAAQRASAKDAPWGTYHFSGRGEASWYEFATEIVSAQARHTGKHPLLKPLSTEEYPTLARRPKNSRLNSDLFESAFGIRARPWQDRTRSIVDLIHTERSEH